MIGSVGAQSGMHYLRQAHQAQASASMMMDPTSNSTDSDDSVSSAADGDGASSSSGASGVGANMLSQSTLASLLGLQMVNGQAQGGASGAQLGLSQMSMPSGMDPNSLLSDDTQQMLQSVL